MTSKNASVVASSVAILLLLLISLTKLDSIIEFQERITYVARASIEHQSKTTQPPQTDTSMRHGCLSQNEFHVPGGFKHVMTALATLDRQHESFREIPPNDRVEVIRVTLPDNILLTYDNSEPPDKDRHLVSILEVQAVIHNRTDSVLIHGEYSSSSSHFSIDEIGLTSHQDTLLMIDECFGVICQYVKSDPQLVMCKVTDRFVSIAISSYVR